MAARPAPIAGNVTDNGTLAFNRSDTFTFAGVVSGAGALVQAGTAPPSSPPTIPYSGGTAVLAGTLAVGDPAHSGAALSGGGPVDVVAGATLGGYGSVAGMVANQGTVAVADALPVFAGSANGTFTVDGTLDNGGLLQIGGQGVGNRLVVIGNLVGRPGSTAAINTVLGADGSPSDRIVIDGGAASGQTSLFVTNRGGHGARTASDGILVVEALNGASADGFALGNTVSAGGYDYNLLKGGLGGGTPQDWYLRTTSISPEVPVAELIALAARLTNTFHERRGDQDVLVPGTISRPPGVSSAASSIRVGKARSRPRSTAICGGCRPGSICCAPRPAMGTSTPQACSTGTSRPMPASPSRTCCRGSARWAACISTPTASAPTTPMSGRRAATSMPSPVPISTAARHIPTALRHRRRRQRADRLPRGRLSVRAVAALAAGAASSADLAAFLVRRHPDGVFDGIARARQQLDRQGRAAIGGQLRNALR